MFLLLSTLSIAWDGDAWDYNGASVYVTPYNFTNNKSVCLQDGTNCPAGATGLNNYPTNLTVTNGSTHTITIGRSGLSTLIASFDDQNSGGGGGNITLAQWLINWSSSNIGNATSLAAGLVNLTLAQVNTNMQNWSLDRSKYINFTILNQQNNLSLAQIVANIGNDSTLDRNKICYSNQSNCAGVTNGTPGSSTSSGWLNSTNTVWLAVNTSNVTVGSTPTLFVDNTNSRVGIGTTTPNFALDVDANVNGVNGFRVRQLSNGTSAQVQNVLVNDIGAFSYYGLTSSNYNLYTPINGGRAFFGSYLTDTSIFTQSAKDIILSTNGAEVMRMKSGGNIGINTSAPGTTLDVVGTVNVTTLQTNGTTRISSIGVGTFATGTTVNSKAVCLSDGTNCAAVSNGTGVGGVIQGVQAKDTWAIVENATVVNVTLNTTLLNNTFVQQANLSSYMLNFMNVWRLGSQVISNNTQVTAGYGITFEGAMIGINNATIDARNVNIDNNRSGWLNASNIVYLANNITNVSVGARNVMWIDTSLNRTGFNTNVPGNTVEVNGTLNASTLLQGVKTVCLSDLSNCGAIGNGTVTSIASSNYLLGGTITTTGTLSVDTAGLLVAFGNYTADKSILTYDAELIWQNSSTQLTLKNNNTNISLNFGSFFINTAQNRTGIGISNPGSALDVSGTINGTTLLQGGKSVCLGDGTNCPSTSNSSSRGGNVSGGGSTGYIPKMSNSTDITNSIMQDTGILINVSGNMTIGTGGNLTGGTLIAAAGTQLILNGSKVNVTAGIFAIKGNVTGSIGGGALLAGACASGTTTIAGATTTGMVAFATPETYPGDGFPLQVYISSANTVTVKVCAEVAGTPTASLYQVRVIA